jgi:hypothetical protein
MRVSQVGRDRTVGPSEVEYFVSYLFGSVTPPVRYDT